ncbi:hypothetical protein Hanom_Chr15g01398901 [Helianthus anomalus]
MVYPLSVYIYIYIYEQAETYTLTIKMHVYNTHTKAVITEIMVIYLHTLQVS